MSNLENSIISPWKMPDFNNEAIEDLRDHCNALQLSSTGSKSDLVCRLLDHYKERAEIKFKHILEKSGMYKDYEEETGREMIKIMGIFSDCQKQMNVAREKEAKQKASIMDLYKAAFDLVDGMEVDSVEDVVERLSKMEEIMISVDIDELDSHPAGKSSLEMPFASSEDAISHEGENKGQCEDNANEQNLLSSIGLPPTLSAPFKNDEEMYDYDDKYCKTPPYDSELWEQEYLEEQLTRALLQPSGEDAEHIEGDSLMNADEVVVNDSMDIASRYSSPLSSAPSSPSYSRQLRVRTAQKAKAALAQVVPEVKKRGTRGQATRKTKPRAAKKGKRGRGG